MLQTSINAYFATLGTMADRMLATDADGLPVALDRVFEDMIAKARLTHDAGNKLMFIGNGGSSTICSHMAEDFTKAANIRAMAFNDAAFLTCLGNDLGYDQVFSKQIEMFAMPGDVLVAISSSGNSANILNGVAAARQRGCTVVTLSGFKPDNRLRGLGDINIYVPSGEYGFVEITHLAIIHAMLDMALGWRAQPEYAPLRVLA